MEISEERIINLETGVAKVSAELSSVHKTIDDIRLRLQAPRLGVVFSIAGTIALVLLTIGTMALAPVHRSQERTLEALEALASSVVEHISDGHPESVKADLSRIFALIQEEHKEQEIDIEQIRTKLLDLEDRNDSQDARLAVMETTMEERTTRFEDVIDLKAEDRWTGSQQTEHEKRLKDEFHRLRAADSEHTEQMKQLGDRMLILEKKSSIK